jgi:hypothetical protein
MEELKNYFGRDPMPVVSSDFKPVSNTANLMFKPDGSIFYMGEYTYTKDINDPKSPSIGIQLNKGALPLRDCFYTSAPKESIIGTTTLVVGHAKVSGDPAEGSYEIYTAQFIYNGIGYDITANRIDQKSFVDLLQSIIK